MKTLLKILAGFVTRLVNELKDILSGVRLVIYHRFPLFLYKQAMGGNKDAQYELGLDWAAGIKKPKANVPADIMAACYAEVALNPRESTRGKEGSYHGWPDRIRSVRYQHLPMGVHQAKAFYILGVLQEEGIGRRMSKDEAERFRYSAETAGIVTIRDLVGHTKYDAECFSSWTGYRDRENLHRTMMHGFINAYVPSFWGH